MNRTIQYEIKDNYIHILDFLKEQGYSHGIIVALKKTKESILKNGIWAYVKEPLSCGDILTIHISENEDSPNIVPTEMPLSIIYEDEDILVINKPAFLPIHPSLNHYEDTLANGIMDYYQKQNIPFVFRCMNRLDRDTSGLTVIAKNPLSAAILNESVKMRTLKRTYLCICEGLLEGTGSIEAPIGRCSDSMIMRQVDFENGQYAKTNYKALLSNQQMSLVMLQLETGRTHQIRVHLSHIGHPLIGDFLYNPGNTKMQRQALHSYRLSFLHPITKEPLTFTAPLPKDMCSCIGVPDSYVLPD